MAVLTILKEIHLRLYTLVIDEYSDEIYLGLQELISENISIDINGVDYVFDKTTISPQWDKYSQYGFGTFTIIRTDTIKTKRRNCCG